MGCGESKSDAVDAGEVRLVEASARVDAELERIEQEGQAKIKEAQELVEAKIERIKQSGSAWTIESFAASLGVARAVSDALLHDASLPEGGEFALVQSLSSREEIAEKLSAGRLVERVADVLSTGTEKLKTAQAATGAELNKKFAADAFKGEMGFGGTKEYYGGLEGVIGSPTFLDGSLLKQAEREHCGLKDAELPFDTSNGIQGTTSAREWEFVVSPKTDGAEEYTERGGDFREKNPEWCRKAIPLAFYEEKMRAKNEELKNSGQTELILEELVAGRLYSGPMYEKYNAVLRFSAAKNPDGSVKVAYSSVDEVPFLQKKCGSLNLGVWTRTDSGVRWEWHNKYATTIHAINSVVVKCSRLTVVKPLYRGWTGATLPKSFFEQDKMGVKGGIEYGFSSTTTEREQAAHYAQGKASTILELQMGMVDRGADISWLSQYPHEKETLLPPLMGLQVNGTSVDGGTLVVECRISINMASLTLEQVAGKRKKLLGDMVEQMAGEVRTGLASSASADEAGRMVQTKLEPMLKEDAQAFNKDVHFQKSVDEALKTKRSVELAAMIAEAGGLEAAIDRVQPLQGNVVDLSEMELGEDGGDVAVVVAWMGSNPSGLTRLKIDVPKASAEVVAALHKLVAQTVTLVDLDAMEKNAPNLNVLQLNGTEKVTSIDLKRLGSVSAAIIGACIQRNPILESLKCAAARPSVCFLSAPLDTAATPHPW